MRKKLAEDEIVVRNRYGGAVWAGMRQHFQVGKDVTCEGEPYRISRLVPKAEVASLRKALERIASVPDDKAGVSERIAQRALRGKEVPW